MALVLAVILLGSMGFWIAEAAAAVLPDQSRDIPRSFLVKGVVTQVKADSKTIVVRHEAISNYMDAMTMPFKVKEPKELVGLQTGDEISFRLLVTSKESWIEGIVKSGTRPPGETVASAGVEPPSTPGARKRHPLMDYKFTNELGQAVSLGDFRGQALAITFFSPAARFLIIVRGCRRTSGGVGKAQFNAGRADKLAFSFGNLRPRK